MTGVRLSRRFPDTLAPNPLSLRLEERRRRGLPLVDLTATNPTQVGFEAPSKLLEALTDPGGGVYHPEPRGLPEARAAVAGYYAARGITVDPGSIVLTASTSEGYAYLFKLLGDPGSTILAPRPSYPLFSHLAELEGLEVESYPLRLDRDGWRVDLRGLEAALDRARDPRGVIVVHPNNPTGSRWSREERAVLLDRCRDRGLPVIADEVFLDFPLEPRAGGVSSWVEDAATSGAPLVFVLSGLSKVAALPQVKLSWIVTPADPAIGERLDLIADTYLSVGGPVQWGASRFLAAAPGRRDAIAARLATNLARLRAWEGRTPGVEIPRVEGGWSAVIVTRTERTDEELALALLDGAGVYIHPGFFYDFDREGSLVVSLLVPPETLDAGLSGIAELLPRG